MEYIRFEWDKNKAKSNIQKHGVGFEEARSCFFDPYARLIIDENNSTREEERFILLGLSHLSRLLIVCHCYRTETEVVRLISVRKANKSEEKQYGGFKNES